MTLSLIASNDPIASRRRVGPTRKLCPTIALDYAPGPKGEMFGNDEGGGHVTEASAPLISVVIPTFNRVAGLQRLLESLSVQTLDPSQFETVIVSDGSTDGTDGYLAGVTPVPVVHARQENAGPAAARNQGIQLARGRLVLFIDDDIVASKNLLEQHLKAHGDSLRTVVIGPMLNAPGFEYSPWVGWEQAKLYKQYRAMRDGVYRPTFRQFYTGNASVPRELLIEVGGFDTTFRRAEDVEMAYRLDQLGVTWVFDESAAAHHWATRSYDSWLAAADAYGRNDVTFARDHDHQWMMPAMISEFRRRNVLTRALVTLCLARPDIAQLATRALRATGVATRKLPRVSGFALSGVYALTYYLAAAEQYGDRTAFREILLQKNSADHRPLS